MPDGSKLRLVKVTYGTNNHCAYGHRPQDLLYSFVPAKYRTNFNFQVATVSTPQADNLVVWMERTGIPSNGTPSLAPRMSMVGRPAVFNGIGSFFLSSPHPFSFSIFDDSGLETSRLPLRLWSYQSGAAELDALVVSTYARPAKSIGIRARPISGDAQPVVEFHVPNPAPPPRYL
jgi:hypothetical protein